MWEMPVWSLGREDPLEEGMTTHSSVLAWRIPWTECTCINLNLPIHPPLSLLVSICFFSISVSLFLFCKLDQFSSVQLLSHVWVFVIPWIAARQASLSITNSWSLLKLMSTEFVMPSNHLILCCPAFNLSQHQNLFPRSQFFASGGQSTGVSASASVLPMNIQDWFPLRLTGLISLQSKGLSKSSPIPRFKSISSLVLSFLYGPALISVHGYWIALTRWIFVGKVMSLLANMLSRLQIRSSILFF